MALIDPFLGMVNNLGGGYPAVPEYPGLGTLLNGLGVPPNPDIASGAVVDLYIQRTGTNGLGAGTLADPWTGIDAPQSAVDACSYWPAPIGTIYRIHDTSAAAATFNLPDVSRVPEHVTIMFVGNTTAPVRSGTAGQYTFAVIAGKEAEFRGNIGAYGDVITATSHWVYQEYLSIDPTENADFAYNVMASATPNLDVVNNFDFGTLPWSLHARMTTFSFAGRGRTVRASQQGRAGTLGLGGGNVVFVGITCDLVSIGPQVVVLDGLNLQGCNLTDSGVGTGSFDFLGGLFSSLASDSPVAFYPQSRVVTAHFVNSGVQMLVATYSTDVNFLSCVFSGATLASYEGFPSVSFVDWDMAAGLTCILGFGGGVAQGADCTVSGGPATFISNSNNAFAGYRRVGGTITGAVTGTAVTLQSGAQALSIEAACAGNLTAGVSEIIVGGNAGATFASLPATDVLAVSTQFCRAT